MILLVDLGNTRVKWAWLEGGARSPSQAAAWAAWSTSDWRSHLFAQRRPERVVACSVAPAVAITALRESARHHGVEVELLVPQRQVAGVVNGYDQPAQLGADRWAAVIGAWHDRAVDCCIVNVGTALTIDVVTRAGRHLGGLIVPGPDLMVDALHGRTGDLARRSADSPARTRAPLATDTRSAIENGCELALAALIDRECARLTRELGHAPRLLLSGGGAERIRPWLATPAEPAPDLVLRGLAVIATRSTT
jgi:type III pantothenate kinase